MPDIDSCLTCLWGSVCGGVSICVGLNGCLRLHYLTVFYQLDRLGPGRYLGGWFGHCRKKDDFKSLRNCLMVKCEDAQQ